jgi:ectoine hydroxylase-related dioxygenase (phytanoyl-CoA dioxygenase family)
MIQHIDASASGETITKALEADGAVILDHFLDSETLDRFNAELDPLLAAADPARRFLNPAVEWFFGDKTRHLSAVAASSRTFGHEILPHPIYMEVCDTILGPQCADYILNIAHVLDRGPDSQQQMLHRDEAVWAHLPKPHPDLQVASIIALADFTADNGATRVVPGSHRWPKEREASADEIAIAEMSAGSAVIYLGSALHGGGPNSTASTRRRGMHVSYCLGWLRTEENQYLSVPLDVVRTLPKRSQELLGYAAHDALAIGGGYLGTVDLVSPIDLLDSRSSR